VLLRSPATASEHHAWLGGLVEHTLAVAVVCAAWAERAPHVDADMLMAAALLHDVGRARELQVEDAIGATAEGDLQGHLLLGYAMIDEAARRIDGLASARLARLVHAVDCHHGPADRCRTTEARVLLAANRLDVVGSARRPG
jgi:3'-5' exoribonuclease